jgi:hypothetical protein
VTKSNERSKVGLAKSKAQAVVPGSAVKVPAAIDEADLPGDLRTLVQSARQPIATAADSTQTLRRRRTMRKSKSDILDAVHETITGLSKAERTAFVKTAQTYQVQRPKSPSLDRPDH